MSPGAHAATLAAGDGLGWSEVLGSVGCFAFAAFASLAAGVGDADGDSDGDGDGDGLGTGHAAPVAAGGTACRLASAAMDARVAATSCADG